MPSDVTPANHEQLKKLFVALAKLVCDCTSMKYRYMQHNVKFADVEPKVVIIRESVKTIEALYQNMTGTSDTDISHDYYLNRLF
jgi:hypothetical protein